MALRVGACGRCARTDDRGRLGRSRQVDRRSGGRATPSPVPEIEFAGLDEMHREVAARKSRRARGDPPSHECGGGDAPARGRPSAWGSTRHGRAPEGDWVARAISLLLTRHALEQIGAPGFSFMSDPLDYCISGRSEDEPLVRQTGPGQVVDVCVLVAKDPRPTVAVMPSRTSQGRMVGIPEDDALAWYRAEARLMLERDLLAESHDITCCLLRRLGEDTCPPAPAAELGIQPGGAPRKNSTSARGRSNLMHSLVARAHQALDAFRKKSRSVQVVPA